MAKKPNHIKRNVGQCTQARWPQDRVRINGEPF